MDLYFYVIGAPGENELMLQSVMQCLFDSLTLLLRKDVEKKTIFQNLGTVMLATDEICDKGVLKDRNDNFHGCLHANFFERELTAQA